jgi:hypothetical protein
MNSQLEIPRLGGVARRPWPRYHAPVPEGPRKEERPGDALGASVTDSKVSAGEAASKAGRVDFGNGLSCWWRTPPGAQRRISVLRSGMARAE